MKRLAKGSSSKSADDFDSENNAFAAAVNEAMDDNDCASSQPGVDLQDTDGIYQYIQEHDEALEQGEAVSVRSSCRSTSSGSQGQARAPFGLPIVKELPDKSSGSSFFKKKKGKGTLQKIASLPRNMGRKIKSPQQQLQRQQQPSERSMGDQSVHSEARAMMDNRPIPTRKLSRSNSSSWRISQSQMVSKNNPNVPRRGLIDPSVISGGASSSGSSFIMARGRRLAAMGIGDASVSVGSSIGLNSASPSRSSAASASASASASRAGSSLYSGDHYSAHTSSTVRSTRPLMHSLDSERSSTSYQVPMPVMPFETKKANLVRVALAIVFFSMSLTFTLFLGQGQPGTSISSYLYTHLISDENQGVVSDSNSTYETSNGSHLFSTIQELENSHEPNKLGKANYHTPKVNLYDLELEIEIGIDPHVMSEDHYIKYVWLRDVEAKTIVLAKEFKPTDKSPPVLRAKVPYGVTLQPHAYCNVHDLWIGEPFKVPDLN